MTMPLWKASLVYSNANALIAFVTETERKRGAIYSNTSRCFTTENVAMATVAT